MKKIIQITSTVDDLYALTEDGKVYYRGGQTKVVPISDAGVTAISTGEKEFIHGWIELIDEINNQTT